MDRHEYLSKIATINNFIMDNCSYHGTLKDSYDERFTHEFKDEDIHTISYIASSQGYLAVSTSKLSMEDYYDKGLLETTTVRYYCGKRKDIEFVHEDEVLLQKVYDIVNKHLINNALFVF